MKIDIIVNDNANHPAVELKNCVDDNEFVEINVINQNRLGYPVKVFISELQRALNKIRDF